MLSKKVTLTQKLKKMKAGIKLHIAAASGR